MGGESGPQADRRRKSKKGHQQHSIVDVSLLGEGKEITSYRLGEREVCVTYGKSVSGPQSEVTLLTQKFYLNLLSDLK